MAPLVDDARELLGLGGDERATWTEAIEPGLTIDADPDQLARVLLNLARNALPGPREQGRDGRFHLARSGFPGGVTGRWW